MIILFVPPFVMLLLLMAYYVEIMFTRLIHGVKFTHSYTIQRRYFLLKCIMISINSSEKPTKEEYRCNSRRLMSDRIVWGRIYWVHKKNRIKKVQHLGIKIVIQVVLLWVKIKIVKCSLQVKDNGKRYRITSEQYKANNSNLLNSTRIR